jgi:hypothetical protein
MMTLKWAKGPNGWISLADHDFSGIKAIGVYVIWCDGSPSTNIRAGSGIIGARITAHKNDPIIMRHNVHGTLRVTWAEVPSHLMERVERYLADRYQPIEGVRYPDVEPLVVNLPGQ